MKKIQFYDFKKSVQDQFKKMQKKTDTVFLIDVPKDKLWETYLSSFPEGTNPIYRERTEHDCQCCKSFIRNYGRIVIVDSDYKLHSIWDCEVEGQYEPVAKALSKLVHSKNINNQFLPEDVKLGTDFNHEDDDGDITKWEHFYIKYPSKFTICSSVNIGSLHSENQACKSVFKRGLNSLSIEAFETTMELIEQGSLYRGDQFENTVSKFMKFMKQHKKIPKKLRDNFYWITSMKIGQLSKFNNSAIGTLVNDLSDGVELNKAVASFEKKVAPENYQRPAPVVTKTMVKKAEKRITDLGFMDSLQRRMAVMDDITINNVLFANRKAKKTMNVFDEISKTTKSEKKDKLQKIEEVGIWDFITNILHKVDTIKVLLENKHESNLVSLIAPDVDDSSTMFNWRSSFSWAYNGNVADSIIMKRVKSAGGNVDAFLRFSLSWDCSDDLDLHVIEPNGNTIYYANKAKKHESSGLLDVDANAGTIVNNPCENITYSSLNAMPNGVYRVIVNQYCARSNTSGFTFETAYNDETYTMKYPTPVKSRQQVQILNFKKTKSGIKFTDYFKKNFTGGTIAKELWGINSGEFHNVSIIMNSPNHWNGEETGNKHYFFMLEDCIRPESARGFFNEFLKPELKSERKMMEVLGSKMRAESVENQLSGIGFSSTKRNSLIVKVTGSFHRTLKIKF